MNLKITSVTAKQYVCVGSDNWAMPLPRPECDAALAEYLQAIRMPCKLAIEAFRNTPEFQAKQESWSVVLAHLARLTQSSPDEVPLPVGVALWGQAIEGHRGP